jgi:hypothetical protein
MPNPFRVNKDLSATVARLTGELATAGGTIAEHLVTIAALTGERDTLTASLAEATGKLAGLDTAQAALAEKAAAASKAVEIVASAGIPVIATKLEHEVAADADRAPKDFSEFMKIASTLSGDKLAAYSGAHYLNLLNQSTGKAKSK